MRLFLSLALAVSSLSLVSAQEDGWSNPRIANIAKPASRGPSSTAIDIRMRDNCDPATFNRAVPSPPNAPPTCVGDGNLTFDRFIAELTEDRTVGAWRFNPDKTDGTVGQMTLLENRGGEFHTFTKVKEFGGGFIGILNDLSGNSKVAPECADPAVVATDGVAPGKMKYGPTLQMSPGEQKFQCCIHPWMRTTVTVQSANGK